MAVYFKKTGDAGVPTLNGAAGSLITLLDYCLVTTAGWTKSYSGTNLATYRPPSGNQHYLAVDDTGTLNARVRGFVTCTAAGVAEANGTNPFPTDAQMSGGGYLYKSSDTGTARNFVFVGSDKGFYLSINGDGTYNYTFFFGDIVSYKSGDAYHTLIVANTNTSPGSYNHFATLQSSFAVTSGHWMARINGQTGASIQVGKVSNYTLSNAAGSLGASGATYPDSVGNSLLASPAFIVEAPPINIRGHMPGLVNPLHNKPMAHLDTFTGGGDLSGKTFVVLNNGTGSQFCIETSDTWYS